MTSDHPLSVTNPDTFVVSDPHIPKLIPGNEGKSDHRSATIPVTSSVSDHVSQSVISDLKTTTYVTDSTTTNATRKVTQANSIGEKIVLHFST